MILISVFDAVAAGINNGILLIRNSDWSRRFWGEVSSHATTEVGIPGIADDSTVDATMIAVRMPQT